MDDNTASLFVPLRYPKTENKELVLSSSFLGIYTYTVHNKELDSLIKRNALLFSYDYIKTEYIDTVYCCVYNINDVNKRKQ